MFFMENIHVLFLSWRIRTSFQDYHKISCVFLHFGRVFKLIKIIFKILFFENPFHQKGGRMGDHALWAKLKIFLTCAEREVIMSYTLDPHHIFIWYHDWYFFVYSYFVFYICMLQTSNSINFDWYLYFHTYMWFDCAYIIFTS